MNAWQKLGSVRIEIAAFLHVACKLGEERCSLSEECAGRRAFALTS